MSRFICYDCLCCAAGTLDEELEVQGGFSEAAYTATARLVAWVCLQYGLPCDKDHVIAGSATAAIGGPATGQQGLHGPVLRGLQLQCAFSQIRVRRSTGAALCRRPRTAV